MDDHIRLANIESALAEIKVMLVERDLRYNQRFDAQETANVTALAASQKATDAALAAVKEANDLAAANIDKWQRSANEWRGAMTDREGTFLPRKEYDESRKAGRSFSFALVAAFVGVAGLLLGVVGTVITIVTLFAR